MIRESIIQKDPVDPPHYYTVESPGEHAGKEILLRGNHRPDIPDTTSFTTLAGRHADFPVAVAILLLIATPFFTGSAIWPSLAAAILASAFAIPFFIHTREMHQEVRRL
jgi:hypothetical protein